ncbi:MAG: 30S ribosomal protein S8 [Patescibacteria group bacterium]|nr:30S ribosomal protein S8 [Patescibacteria group bacterium]
MNHNVSDFIIRIKNAALAKRKEVILPFSNINKEIGRVLVREGFLENIKEENVGNKKSLKAVVKYEKRLPVLTDVIIISKPSLRVYEPARRIGNIQRKGKKIVIISTSLGVMTGNDALKKGIGGEILFTIW